MGGCSRESAMVYRAEPNLAFGNGLRPGSARYGVRAVLSRSSALAPAAADGWRRVGTAPGPPSGGV